jgi:hypothetical protein
MNAEAPRPLIYKDGKAGIIAKDGRWIEVKKPAVPPPPPPPKANQNNAGTHR